MASSSKSHDDVCRGLHRAIDHLERGDDELAALEVLSSVAAAARAREAGEISRAQESALFCAAREILLAAVRTTQI